MQRVPISALAGAAQSEVTVAFLVAVGAAESGRPTLMFLTKEAVRLALPGFAQAVACEGCPPLTDLVERYEKAGGTFLVFRRCGAARRRLARAPGTVALSRAGWFASAAN